MCKIFDPSEAKKPPLPSPAEAITFPGSVTGVVLAVETIA